MCNPDHIRNEAEQPLGPRYQIADPRAFRHVDPKTFAWFLRHLGQLVFAEHIDRVVLFGRRASGEEIDGVDAHQTAHEFAVVLDDEAPDDLSTGTSDYPAFLDELHKAVRASNVLGVDVTICRKAHWAESDVEDRSLMSKMRRGAIIAARL